jgi:hypothetical protein
VFVQYAAIEEDLPALWNWIKENLTRTIKASAVSGGEKSLAREAHALPGSPLYLCLLLQGESLASCSLLVHKPLVICVAQVVKGDSQAIFW